MRRRVLLALAWLPAVLCAGLWVGSYWTAVGVLAHGYGGFAEAGGTYWCGPSLFRDITNVWAERPRPQASDGVEKLAGTPVQRWKPFRVLRPSITARRSHTIYCVPLWLPTLALALPAAWLTRRWRPRRAPGLCPACGYDLRATRGRCLECGTIPNR